MSASKIAKLSNKCYKNGWGGVAQLLKNINRLVYSCDVAFNITLGERLDLHHQGLGVVVGPSTIIGDDVLICQNVTIGGKQNGGPYQAPSIGNHVMIGAGAVVLGAIKIGNNVRIGANSVVLTDVPDNCIAVGAPARIKRIVE